MKKKIEETKKEVRKTKKGAIDNRVGNGGAHEKKGIREVREIIKDFVSDYMNKKEQLEIDLQMCKPKERLDIIVGLLKYVTPALQNIDLSTVKVEVSKIDQEIEKLDEELKD